MSGCLYLVPTPLDENAPFSTDDRQVLHHAWKSGARIVVEEIKVARRRWLVSGLPREAIEEMRELNEHSSKKEFLSWPEEIKAGLNIYLMSDGGLPAFCDPGVELVNLCHQNGARVSSLPFCNSVALALALSGLDTRKFVFEGFIPQDKNQRVLCFEKMSQESRPIVIMETPYRLAKMLEQLQSFSDLQERTLFLACDLNTPQESLWRGPLKNLPKMQKERRSEAVVVLGPSVKRAGVRP